MNELNGTNGSKRIEEMASDISATGIKDNKLWDNT